MARTQRLALLSALLTLTIFFLAYPPPVWPVITSGISVQFGADSYTVEESSGAATLIVTLSEASTSTVTVNYASNNGTAVAGTDYTNTWGTLTFAPGVTSQTITVPILDKGDFSGQTVNFSVQLSAPSGATLGTPSTATVSILDNDPAPSVQFASSGYTVNESAGSATLTVTLSPAAAISVSVDYGTSDGTAAAGTDYTTTSGTLTFAAGQTAQTITVPILDKGDFSGQTLWFTVGLSNPTAGVNLGSPSTATVSILDNDAPPTVQFAASTYTVNENAGTANLIVTLSNATDVSVSVDYATSDGTALAGTDYTTTDSTLTFAPGQTSQTISVPILDKGDFSGQTLWFSVALSNPTSGVTMGSPSMATVSILDNDSPPSVQFASSAYTANESDGSVTLTVTLSNATDVPISVDYATCDGTAVAGIDYTTVLSTLTFAAGQTSQTLSVPILDKGDYSGQILNFSVLLSNPTGGASLGSPSTATVSILDDDSAPSVQFACACYAVDESAGTASLTVTLSSPTDISVSVNYATNDGTALAGTDYITTSGSLTFGAGQTIQMIDVPILDKGDFSGQTLWFSVALSSPTAGTSLGSPSTTTVSILDDDPPPSVQFAASGYTVYENAGTATLTVTLSNPTDVSVSVDYATADATALAGTDYTSASATLTFAAGQTTQTISVPILNKGDFSGQTVNFTVALSNPTGGVILGLPSTATVAIVDNDPAPSVQFTSSSYTVYETADTAVLTVSLSSATDGPVTVNYATSDGSAVAGTDYITTSGALTFAAGENTQTISVPVLDTGNYSGDTVTFTVSLSNPTGGVSLGSPSTTTVSIIDDAPALSVQFASSNYTTAESGGSVPVTVTLSSAAAVAVTVDYATSDGSAVAGTDYLAASGTLTFPAGQTTQTINVVILDTGNFSGGSLTFSVGLSNPTGGASLGSPSTATVSISENDQVPSVQFAASSYTVDESAGVAVVTVTLDTTAVVPISVNYATSDGTALAGIDYSASSATLTFTPGQTSQAISIPIIDKGDFSGQSVSFTVTLSSPTGGATLGSPSTTAVSITDDDLGPSVQFAYNAYTVNETDSVALIGVTLSNAADVSVSVDYGTSDGSAVAGTDYTTTSGTLTFAPAQTTQTITVPILNNGNFSGQTLSLGIQLSNPTAGVTLGDPSTATIFVDDVSPLTVQFASSTYSVNETCGAALLDVTLGNAVWYPVSVDYTTSDGTALAGTDYTAVCSTLTFAPGEISQTISVPITNLGDFSGQTLNFTVQLSNPVAVSLGSPSLATVSILDADPPPRSSSPAPATTQSMNTSAR